MALPVNINDLLNGEVVEWDRIEFKKGWNPEQVIRTICAFANDINNWGGGYIFIGIEEKNGKPVLPPKGLPRESLDAIQKGLINLSHQLQPFYFPVSQPYVIKGKHILAIWAPGGDNRPYKAPSTLGDKADKKYYVRRGSATVSANQNEERLLLEMAKRIPFDDRVNHHAKLDHLQLTHIQGFLSEIKSDLYKESTKMPLADIARQMRIAAGPPESLLPVNAGLLFFNDKPEQFFAGAKTELVGYEDETGKEFTEKRFTGPLHLQIKSVLDFIRSNVIRERVIKQSQREGAQRAFNYPFAALEEVIVNAFYHRSYELDNPIEINVFPDRIEVLSFPGPLPPVNRAMLKQRRIVARNYRNRRVGDFLKELKLTEGRATGFPTIHDSMNENGSPKAVFQTDDDYSYFLAVLPVHFAFKAKTTVATENELQILLFCMQAKKRVAILKKIGLSNHPKNYQNHIVPLVEKGWLAYTLPDKPTSPNQEYITTSKGKGVLG